jgi:hypothetical protein
LNCHALNACIENPIQLKVYLDDQLEASGNLYLDDGKSYDYLHSATNGNVYLTYTYKNGQILTSNSLNTTYSYPGTQVLESVIFYGMTQEPILALAGGTQSDFIYNAETQELFMDGLGKNIDMSPLVEITFKS